MSKDKMTFQRYELKYLVSDSQRREILAAIGHRMSLDKYGKSTIKNIYFDTPDMRIIRRSLEGPAYKEKLRLRSYAGGDVFLELKKKYDQVVYKRREKMTEQQALEYICAGKPLGFESQILSEIEYFLKFYRNLKPSMFLSYDREAYFDREDPELRVTFDDNILWRVDGLRFDAGIGGEPVLKPGQSLMEIKISGAMPLWLSRILSEAGAYKTSFSKYGRAYLRMRDPSENGGERQCLKTYLQVS